MISPGHPHTLPSYCMGWVARIRLVGRQGEAGDEDWPFLEPEEAVRYQNPGGPVMYDAPRPYIAGRMRR